MLEQQAKNSILCDLKSGSIQPFEIEKHLRKKGISPFEAKRLESEITQIYKKECPRN